MSASDPGNESRRVEATQELKRLLAPLSNGDSLSIVENGVVIGQLRRIGPNGETADAEFTASVEAAGRFMDRYSDAYRALAK